MHRSRLVRTTLVLLALTMLWGATAAMAAGPAPARIDPALGVGPGLTVGQPLGPARADGQVSLLVRLKGPSVTQLYTAHQATARTTGSGPLGSVALRTLADQLEARQQPATQAVEGLGATVVDHYTTAYYGLLVHARRDQIQAIARVPGVESVSRAPIMKLDMQDAVPMLRADKVWQDLGWDGTGSVVALIDTGVDYTHKYFGGPGTVAAYEANDPNVVEPGTFPTAKVIGGYDLAGEIYSPGCVPGPDVECTAEPTPEDDPLDVAAVGHGTHTSGIVGGLGVSATGLYKGIAPGAKLVMLKVFGNPVGAPMTTDLSGSAIEWVTQHNLNMDPPGISFPDKIDVINLSLGADFGGSNATTNELMEAAVAAGVTVVASAGNDYDVPFIVGSPSASNRTVSVASSVPVNEKIRWLVAEWEENGAQRIEPDIVPISETWLPSIDTTGKIAAPLAWYGFACNDDNGQPTEPAQDVNEKIALIERGTCSGIEKITNAEAKGAVAVIIYTTETQAKARLVCAVPPEVCPPLPDIPAWMIDRAPGLQLKDTVFTKNIPVTATMDPANALDLGNTISVSSSRGPARFSAGIKPQITAPGDAIFSASAGTGDQGVTYGGTSMSGPMVAGEMALLWQRNRAQSLNLKPLEIGALAMNYARPIIEAERSRTQPVGPLVGVPRQGAGTADAYASATGNTVLTSPEGVAELNFSQQQVTERTSVAKKVVVKNLGQAAKHYKLASRFMFTTDVNKGVGLSIVPQDLTLEPGKSAEVTVTGVIDPSRLKPWDLRSHELLLDSAKVQDVEIDGFVSATEVDGAGQPVTAGDVANMPFYVLPRRASCLESTNSEPFTLPAKDATFEQTWKNPCGLEAPMLPFTAVGSDPAESQDDPTWPAKIDIQHVTAYYGLQDPTDLTSDTILVFGVHGAGAWRIPFDSETLVYLDYDQDGNWDEVLYNVYGPYLMANDARVDRRFLVAHAPLLADGITPDYFGASGTIFFQSYDINDQSAFFPAIAGELNGGDLDLSKGTATFNVGVLVADNAGDYAQTPTYVGFDLAPDGAHQKPAKGFTFDQRLLDCLHLVGDTEEYPLGQVEMTFPANAANITPVTFKLACDPPQKGADLTVLYWNPANVQGGDMGWHVRTGRIGAAAAPPAVYLPYLASGHDLMPMVSVPLNAVGEGGVAGTAILRDKGTKLEVTLEMPGAPTDTPHPAQMRMGSCGHPGEVFRILSPVENGRSVKLLDGVKLAEVTNGGYYINVHKSVEDPTEIACGHIPATAPAP